MKKKPKIKVDLTRQEIDDLLSAIHFFIAGYPSNGASLTKKSMSKLSKRLWKILKGENEEKRV